MSDCPECGGRYLAGHPAGWLTWQHRLTCTLGQADDQTRHADYLRAWHDRRPAPFTRPATPTERVLLAALGHAPAGDETTHVHPLMPAVTRRTRPQLDQPTPPSTNS